MPELSPSAIDKTEIGFILDSPLQRPLDHTWSYHWFSPSGEKQLSYCWQTPYHWLRFSELADFRVSADVKEIICYPIPGIPPESLRHLLLDQVLPRCLAHQGKFMLHASAVRLEEGLILFIGDSGAGKSTLAGNFHQSGHPAISDDCIWLRDHDEGVAAIPTYGGLRLWEDSLEVLFASEQETHSMAHYSSKKRVPLQEDAQAGEGAPVLAVILLSPPAETSSSAVTLERLPNREAFIAVLKQTFQLDIMDRARMTRHAEALGRMIPRLPAFRLSMARRYDLLPAAREKILEAVLSND
jgi:hypothetical protein